MDVFSHEDDDRINKKIKKCPHCQARNMCPFAPWVFLIVRRTSGGGDYGRTALLSASSEISSRDISSAPHSLIHTVWETRKQISGVVIISTAGALVVVTV